MKSSKMLKTPLENIAWGKNIIRFKLTSHARAKSSSYFAAPSINIELCKLEKVDHKNASKSEVDYKVHAPEILIHNRNEIIHPLTVSKSFDTRELSDNRTLRDQRPSSRMVSLDIPKLTFGSSSSSYSPTDRKIENYWPTIKAKLKEKKKKPYSIYRERQKWHNEKFNSMLDSVMRWKEDINLRKNISIVDYFNELKSNSKSVATINTSKELKPKQAWKDKIMDEYGRQETSISIRSFPRKFKPTNYYGW
ncbi:unnamed protein product [Blepharisma stoltei]|uniref:Uncharacterized protein n=1 Tax=Blepharisma stoltei TaxID=1481888 RepID=A0AAU9K6K9_9CILI|nr:unnamed protein product [Blepharisma stoltei]